MEYCMLTQKVEDFNTWKLEYDTHSSVRDDFGITVLNVFRGKEDKNSISILAKADTPQIFEKFFMSEELHEAMKRAGVITKPEITWLEHIE